jgi:hypothetical protein
MRGFILLSLAAVLLLPAGCEKAADEVPTPSPTPVASTPTTLPASPPAWQPSEPKIARFAGLVGDKPAIWIEHPPQGRMRAANYTVPGRDGNEAAHVVVFDSIGGSIDKNIDRWQSQFEPDENRDLVEPQISRFEAGGMAVTLVELAGSWRKMGASWFTPDQLFITAIVETPRGNVFIRFAGQTATVEGARPEFIKMVRSLHADDQ